MRSPVRAIALPDCSWGRAACIALSLDGAGSTALGSQQARSPPDINGPPSQAEVPNARGLLAFSRPGATAGRDIGETQALPSSVGCDNDEEYGARGRGVPRADL